MKVLRLEIVNFRSFDRFALELHGQSAFFIGANGVGKSSILTAMARALGRDLSFPASDFRDLTQPVEIQITMGDLSADDLATFANHVDFSGQPTLQLEARATWNTSSDDADVEHRYPKTGARSRREERDVIPLDWLPSARDPDRMLRLGAGANLMARMLDRLQLGASLAQAVTGVQAAASTLAADPSLAAFLTSTGTTLAELVSGVQPGSVTLGAAAVTPKDLLRQFELYVAYGSDPLGVGSQSSGIGQLTIFAIALLLARAETGRVLMVDEPEISLHPQSQRALLHALTGIDSQVLIATHSAHLVDRADPRRVHRLHKQQGAVLVSRPSTLTDGEAAHLSRFTNTQVAEAFFAQTVILVEGLSDQRALEALADKHGRNLDADGVSIVPLNGAKTIHPFLKLFGPNGFNLKVAGLCDKGEEQDFIRAIQSEGIAPNATQADREQLGFYVNSTDLEDELLRALGTAGVDQVIATKGDTAAFASYRQQPTMQGVSLADQQKGFLRNSRRKIEYAPLLVDAIPVGQIPPPLEGVLRGA